MSFSNKGSGFIYGIGYDFNISDNFDLRISYNYLKNIAGISYFHTNRFSVGFLGKF
jgi:outer membrane autotransporter protein